MAADDVSRFSNLTFEGFRALARDGSLSKYERIGFPDSYRAGFEEQIFDDIRRKLSNLDSEQRTVLDIGPGASDLPRMMIEHCRARSHDLIIVDSSEMLSHLPDVPGVSKVHGRFPQECSSLLRQYAGRIDAVLVYSVIQYVHVEASLFSFLDHLLMLLAPGGEILIGDIPNIDRRKRFFSSAAGVRFHRAFTGKDEIPAVTFNVLEPGCIDDAVVLGIILHCRRAGLDAFVIPQGNGLPMENRREDILIRRP